MFLSKKKFGLEKNVLANTPDHIYPPWNEMGKAENAILDKNANNK